MWSELALSFGKKLSQGPCLIDQTFYLKKVKEADASFLSWIKTLNSKQSCCKSLTVLILWTQHTSDKTHSNNLTLLWRSVFILLWKVFSVLQSDLWFDISSLVVCEGESGVDFLRDGVSFLFYFFQKCKRNCFIRGSSCHSPSNWLAFWRPKMISRWRSPIVCYCETKKS